MRFHENHGDGIKLLKDGTEAMFQPGHSRHVFSAQPLTLGQCVETKMVRDKKRDKQDRDGCLTCTYAVHVWVREEYKQSLVWMEKMGTSMFLLKPSDTVSVVLENNNCLSIAIIK